MNHTSGAHLNPRGRRRGPVGYILISVVVAILVAPTGQATTRLPGARLASAGGNAVTDWSTITANVVAAKKFPGIAPIFASIVQVAIYDAVIAIEGGYTPYATDIDAPENSSPEAATGTTCFPGFSRPPARACTSRSRRPRWV